MKRESMEVTKQCVLCGNDINMTFTRILRGKDRGKWRIPKNVFYMDVPEITFSDGKYQEGFEYWECPKCAIG